MECVEGESLSARISRSPLSLPEVIRFGIQLADALAHAHEHGVVHRDLKPANIIVTPEQRLKVLDFGLAKRLIGSGPAEPEDATATDLAINYEVPIAHVSAFFQGEVINLFDEQAQINGNTAIVTSLNPAQACRDVSGAPKRCLTFDPFIETPVLGTHYAVPATFGTPRSAADYQTPLTYRFSVGLRF
jgi:serine/threonine protein kinase